jgi:uncharacterized membrane protein YsdA (DUF1294 family)
MSDASSAARRFPVWLANLLTLAALLGVMGVFVGLATLFDHLGWTAAKYVVAVVGLVYGVFAILALIGYLLYTIDREVRRGLNR